MAENNSGIQYRSGIATQVRRRASLGVEGFDARSQLSWYGLLAPAGTPAEAIARIQAESVRALRDEKAAAARRAARIFVVASTTEEFAALIRDGYAAWGKVIRETGVKGE